MRILTWKYLNLVKSRDYQFQRKKAFKFYMHCEILDKIFDVLGTKKFWIFGSLKNRDSSECEIKPVFVT